MADTGTTGIISAAMVATTSTVLRKGPPSLLSAAPRSGYYKAIVLHWRVARFRRIRSNGALGEHEGWFPRRLTPRRVQASHVVPTGTTCRGFVIRLMGRLCHPF